MNIRDFRKNIFINSQYCTYYFENETTVFAGILRDFGYKYLVKFPSEKLQEVGKTYRNFTTAINTVVAIELLLYVYLVIFPHFTEFLKIPFVLMVLMLSVTPLLALIVTYFVFNLLYENYLKRYVGTYQKTKFKPTVDKIDEQAFDSYTKTPKKSVYVIALMMLMFCYYVITPLVIANCLEREKYNCVIKLSNVYNKLIPISPEVHSYIAYAFFKTGKYDKAVEEFEKANKYCNSDNFSDDILGIKTYYLTQDEMLKEFDKAIQAEELEAAKYLLMFEKAKYLHKNKKYSQALDLYEYLLKEYENDKDVFFPPENAYYNRGQVKNVLRPNSGDLDIKIAKNMCDSCDYGLEPAIIHMP